MRIAIGFGLMGVAVVLGMASFVSLRNSFGYGRYFGLFGLLLAFPLFVIGLLVLAGSAHGGVRTIAIGLLLLLGGASIAMKCADGDLPFCKRMAQR